MATAKIDKTVVDAAAPGAADYVIWDDRVTGFGLKVTPSGSKVYLYRYRLARPGKAAQTPPRKYTIGKHGDWTAVQARNEAERLRELVKQGIDPRAQELDVIAAQDEAKRLEAEKLRLEGDLAFEKVAALWLDHYENEKGRRASSVGMAKLVVNRHLKPKLAGKPMPHIGRTDLQAALDVIPVKQRGIRRAVFAYASVLFGWAQQRGDIAENPLRAMAKPEAPKPRDRVLTDDELVTVWNATAALALPFGTFFRLLILTGQRRDEVSGLSWSEVDRESRTWTIPASRAKNGVAHIVPLAPSTIAEMDARAVAKQVADKAKEIDPEAWPKAGYILSTTPGTSISSYSKAKAALDAAAAKERDGAALDAWRVHDLRRTLATGLQRLGVRFEVTEAVLNHVSGARSGVAGIYQRHDWKEEKRAALEAWARHVASILAPADKDNVVPIGAAKGSA